MDTAMLETTPVGDFTLVGLFFVTCYGILPILAMYGLWKLSRWRWTDAVNKWTGQNWAWTATAAIGVILILWIVAEVVLIGSPNGFPRFLQAMMTLFGIVILALAMLPRVRAYTKLVD
jgi:amino acid permease